MYTQNMKYQMNKIIFENYDEVMKIFTISSRIQGTPLQEKEALVYDENHTIIGYKQSFLSRFLTLKDDMSSEA